MRAAWFIGKFELLLNCTKYPIYSPKSRTPQQPQHVRCKRKGRHNRQQTNITTDAKMPTLRKIKRAAMQPHKPTQIAAHLILPNRTKTFSRLTICRQLWTEKRF